MSTLVNWNGQQYLVPAYNDTGYAQGNGNLSQYLVAISTGSLQQVGGLFQLTADADFGPNFGLVSSYFKSRSANIASAGVLRLANTDAIKWRNSDNSADVTLAMNATGTAARTYTIPDLASSYFVMSEGAQTINGSKTFGSAIIGSLTGAASLNLLLTGGTMSGNIAMGGTQKLTGLAAGSTAGDSVRYEQVLLLAGGTMSGNIAMGGTQKLTGLAAGSGNGDSLRYEQAVGVFLPLAGGTMSGDIAMGTKKLTGLGAGTAAGDSVRFEQNKLIQMVVGTSTTQFTTTNSAYQTTNLSATITPTSSSNKIKISVSGKCNCNNMAASGVYVTVFRGGTDLSPGNGAFYFNIGGAGATSSSSTASCMFVDSPSTTSATTYAVKIKNDDGASTIGFGGTSSQQTITLEEIAP